MRSPLTKVATEGSLSSKTLGASLKNNAPNITCLKHKGKSTTAPRDIRDLIQAYFNKLSKAQQNNKLIRNTNETKNTEDKEVTPSMEPSITATEVAETIRTIPPNSA